MRLTDLNPHWLDAGGDGVFETDAEGKEVPVPKRTGIGVLFDCPCGCEFTVFVPFVVALDGSSTPKTAKNWDRTGDTFETLTLSPSIQRVRVPRETAEALKEYPIGTWPGDCEWHGWVEKGEVRKA